MLKRKFYNKLLDWKKKANKKPLFVRGARQIGKTYIIDYFGKTNYSSYIYINFLENSEYKRIFDGALDAATIYSRMSLMIQSARFTENDTLIFLDEIQECGNARTALKFLAQDARYDIVVSGSLLGVQYKNVKSIPVGYEEPVTMHSLDFEEFLWAKGYSQEHISALQDSFLERRKVDDFINDVMHKELREYMVIGGMPAVVQQFIEKRNFAEADEIQRQIVSDYLDDIMNYASEVEKPKIRNCFLSIPRQLARENENRKFKYAEVEKGVGARKYINSVEWLRDASMAEMAHNLTAPLFPLSAYEDESAFKLYLSDIGLLTSLYGFETKAAIINQTISGSVKGALYENLIATGLVRRGYALRYLQDRRIPMEVEFLLEKKGKVVPVEVKASNASTASLNGLLERDDIEFGYKFTSGNVGVAGKKITLPHYMMMFI
jgi:predicted AAA+ superfamily ATPase